MEHIDKLIKKCGSTDRGEAKYCNNAGVCTDCIDKTGKINGFRSGSGREFNICAVLFAFLLLCGIIGGISLGIFSGMKSMPLEEASADSYFAYAYSNRNGSLDAASAEELVTAAASYPVIISGIISTYKYVLVENGTPRITYKSEYSSGNPRIFIYIPEITIGKDYTQNTSINDLIRLVDTPVTNWILVAENNISKGHYQGLTLELYPSHKNGSAQVSTAPVKMQIYDGSTWRDIWLPDDSNYNITEEIKQEADPDLTKCQGLSATIEDCSINGITYQTLSDWEGMVVTVEGAGFTYNASHKWHDATKWFTNLPVNCEAMVRYNIETGSSTTRIILAKHGMGGTSLSTPFSSSSEPIRIVIPLEELMKPNGDRPWTGIAGGVVVKVNPNAVFNIIDSTAFSNMQKPLAVSVKYEGVFDMESDGDSETYLPVGVGDQYTTVYIPSAMLDQLPDEEGGSEGEKQVRFILEPEEQGVFIFNGSDTITVDGSGFKEVCEGVYEVRLGLYLKKLVAKKVTSGEFMVKILTKSGYITLDPQYTHFIYEITDQEHAVVHDDDENGQEGGEGENGSGSGDDTLPSGEAPDIWVNGKDNKKENIYKKSLIKDVSGLIGSVPEDCKLIVSVTDTVVEDASGAFASGKGKKSNTAKAAYKKAENTIVVTAGKTGGTVRIWVAAIDSNKEIQASGHFDVSVGTAPKKLFVSNYKNADMTSAIKSVAVNAGESVKLYANANGTELSEHAKFTWTVSKDNGCLEITPSANTQSAKITVKSAPADGKLLKAAITVVNVESGKKVNCSIMIGNEVTEISGLSGSLTLPSAAEEAVEQKLDYTLVCADGTSFTTDKIKVFTTAALEEGAGFTVTNGRKFTLSSKSKVKVTCKNGEFTLKAAKKTADGTQLRVLVVVTHADKTVEVFESGVITIGEKAE
ncbi:MAG: hypothetical protein J5824_08220 [Lachnospiraceae bacterium]|nr:hypothetical protein [Lachnospiraceae bacterium]